MNGIFVHNDRIATFATTNSPSLIFADKTRGAFCTHIAAIIVRYRPLVSFGQSAVFNAICRTLASLGKLTAFFVQKSNFVQMPKSNEIRVNANNSNAYTASSHETAAITLTQMQVIELQDLISRLGGEEAIDSAYLVTECPNDETGHDYMLRSVLRFYSNVRLLCSEIRNIIAKGNADAVE